MASFPKATHILRNQVRRPCVWINKFGVPYIYNYFSEHHDLHLAEITSHCKLCSMKFPAPVLSGINLDIAIRPRARTNIDHGGSGEVVTSTCFDYSTST